MSSSSESLPASTLGSEPSSLEVSSSSVRTLATSRRIRKLLDISVDDDSVQDLARYISGASSLAFGLTSCKANSDRDPTTSEVCDSEGVVQDNGLKGKKEKESDPHSKEGTLLQDISSSREKEEDKEEVLSFQIPTAAELRSSLEERMMNAHRTFFGELTKLYESFQSTSHLVRDVVQQVDEMEAILRPHGDSITAFVQHMRTTKAALQREEEREAKIRSLYEQIDFKPADQELLLHGPVDVFFLDALERAKVVYKGSKAMLSETQRQGVSSASGVNDGSFLPIEEEGPNYFLTFSEKGTTNTMAHRVYDVGVGAYTAMTSGIQHLKAFLLTPVKQSNVTTSSLRGGTTGSSAHAQGGASSSIESLSTISGSGTLGGGSVLTTSSSMSVDYPELSAFYLRCVRVLYDYDPSTWEQVIQVMADMRRSSVLRRYCHLLATGSATTSAGTYQNAGSHSISLSCNDHSVSSLCLRPLEADLDKPLYFFRAVLAWIHQAIVAEMDLLSNFFFDAPSQCILTSMGEPSAGNYLPSNGTIEESSTLTPFPSASSSTSLLSLMNRIFDHTANHVETAMNSVLERFLPAICILPSPPTPLRLRKEKKRLLHGLLSSVLVSSLDITDGEEKEKNTHPKAPGNVTVMSISPSTGEGKLSFGRRLVSTGFRKIFKGKEAERVPGKIFNRFEKERVLVTSTMLAQQLHLPRNSVLDIFVTSSRSQQVELAEAFLRKPLSGLNELFRLGLLFDYYSITAIRGLLGESSKMWILLKEQGGKLIQQAFTKVLHHLSGHLFRSALMLIVSSTPLQQLEESVTLKKAFEAKMMSMGSEDSSLGIAGKGSEDNYWFSVAVALLQQNSNLDMSSLLWFCFPFSCSFNVLHFLLMYQRPDIDVHGAVFKTHSGSAQEKDAYQFLDKPGAASTAGANSSNGKTKEDLLLAPSVGACNGITTTNPATFPGNATCSTGSTAVAGLIYSSSSSVGKKSDPILHASARELETNVSQVLLAPPVEVRIMVETMQKLKEEYEKQQSMFIELEWSRKFCHGEEMDQQAIPFSVPSSPESTSPLLQPQEQASSPLSLFFSAHSSLMLHPLLFSMIRFLLLHECGWRSIESSPLLSQRLDTPCQYILLLNIIHAVARGIEGTSQNNFRRDKKISTTLNEQTEEGKKEARVYQLVIGVPMEDKSMTNAGDDEDEVEPFLPLSHCFPPVSTPHVRIRKEKEEFEALKKQEQEHKKPSPHHAHSLFKERQDGKKGGQEEGRNEQSKITVGRLARTYQFIVAAAVCAGALHYYFPVTLTSSVLPTNVVSSMASLPLSHTWKSNTNDTEGAELPSAIQSITDEEHSFLPSLDVLLCVLRELLYFFRLLERMKDGWTLPLLSGIEEYDIRVEVDLSVRRALLAYYFKMHQRVSLLGSDLAKLQESLFPDFGSGDNRDSASSPDTQDQEKRKELMSGLEQLPRCTPELLKSYLFHSSSPLLSG